MVKGMVEKEKKIKKIIYRHVKNYYNLVHANKKLIINRKIPYGGRVFDHKELIRATEACLDFWLTTGRFSKEFEQKFAKFLGVKHAILVNSGSSANLLAISALASIQLRKKRLKPGDEVITTACGFPTTLNPIIQNNLIPVFIDIELGTYNIDVDKIEKAISKKTKAIFVAHTLGNPVELGKLLKVVKKYNLWLIEDNCDALGSLYREKRTGSFGHITTSSFYPPHHITMGEGGAVLTNDSFLKKIILSYRDWGRDCWCDSGKDNSCGRRFLQKHGQLPFGYDHKYVYSHIGYNLKITDIQAAIGLEQLKKLPRFIEKRKTNFRLLYKGLKKYEEYLYLPEITKHSEPSWFGFPLTLKAKAPFGRRDIVNYLEKNRIATRMLFGGNLIKQPAYINTKYRIYGNLKNTDYVMNNLFWIGVYPGIDKQQIDYMLDIFKSFFDKKKL